MVAEMDSMVSTESRKATIGQDINYKIKSKTRNTSNNMEAQQQLPGSSELNSTTDDNKTTITYVRLITFFPVWSMDELVRRKDIRSEGVTSLFIKRTMVKELRSIGGKIWSHMTTVGNGVTQVKRKWLEMKTTSTYGKEIQ
jgi:hypothetical protein